MCKSDKDCPCGQTCRQGVCTATARQQRSWLWAVLGLLFGACAVPAGETKPDEPFLIRSGVGYGSQIGTAEGQTDSDFAVDPPAPPHAPTEGPASFAATTESVLAAAGQGQGGRYGAPRPILEEAECQARLVEAQAKEPACAREMYAANCGRSGSFKAAECPACTELYKADYQLEQGKCPPRPIYPTLRVQ